MAAALDTMVEQSRWLERWIRVVRCVLIVLLIVIALRAGYLAAHFNLFRVWEVVPSFALTLSVLAVVLVSDRAVKYQSILRADDRRRHAQMVLHHALYLVNALLPRVGLLRSMIVGEVPLNLLTFARTAEGFDYFYRQLCDREIFTYLEDVTTTQMLLLASDVYSAGLLAESVRIEAGKGNMPDWAVLPVERELQGRTFKEVIDRLEIIDRQLKETCAIVLDEKIFPN